MLGNKIMEVLNIEVCMNKSQLQAYRDGKQSTLSIYLTNNKNVVETAEKLLVYGLAVAIGISKTFNNYGPAVQCMGGMESIDKLGKRFLDILRHGGEILILLETIIEVIRACLKGGDNTAEIAKLIISRIVCVAIMYILPELFDAVKGM